MTPEGRGHPVDERLAEYADGVLSPEDRTSIERHLAVCADCRAALAETMAFDYAEAITQRRPVPGQIVPLRSRRWVLGAAAALTAAAALVIAVRVARPEWLGLDSRPGRTELQELVAAISNEPFRPVEGRLTGGFKYAPPPSSTRGASDHPVSPVVRMAAAKVERAVTGDESPQGKAALGVASLLLGDVDRSIDLLESATSSGTVAPFLSDLAAAYIARGIRRDQPNDFQRALSLAERAIRIDRSLREAYFNYALALQSLGDARAASAWTEYGQRDPQGSWHDEASRYTRPVR